MTIKERSPGIPVTGYAAPAARAPLGPFSFERRAPGSQDVLIDILYCGVCHSDIHQAHDDWAAAMPGIFPMVPGHEIVGKVIQVGDRVEKWKAGDVVGVGCFVDSCRECGPCRAGEEQYCESGATFTYNSYERDGTTPTFGGYSTQITVDEAYVLRIPAGLPLEGAAPLLCAGITTYSPLRRFAVEAGRRIAVVGLGGLGHVAVKLARALGASVAVLSHTPRKREDALRLGAEDFISTNDPSAFEKNVGRFDVILDTVSAPHDYNAYLTLLALDGTMVLLGLPEKPTPLAAGLLIMKRRNLTGSGIGGIRETQEMLDFCAGRGIVADVEVIPIQQINEAYDRVVGNDVRYRFVIDTGSLRKA